MLKKKKQHQTQVQADNSKCLLHTTEHLAQQQKCKEPKNKKRYSTMQNDKACTQYLVYLHIQISIRML